MSYAFLGS